MEWSGEGAQGSGPGKVTAHQVCEIAISGLPGTSWETQVAWLPGLRLAGQTPRQGEWVLLLGVWGTPESTRVISETPAQGPKGHLPGKVAHLVPHAAGRLGWFPGLALPSSHPTVVT